MHIFSKHIKLVLLVFFISIIAVSCLKKEEFPDEPHIEFKSFDISTDVDGNKSATLTIKFTDGDGDIGLNQGDTLGSFCPDTCLFHYNLFCEYYEKIDGNWTHIPRDWLGGDIPFYYRIPDLTPAGQNPSLSGEIVLDMPTYFLSLTPGDTARFEISIVDRSFNISNKVITTEFTKGL